MDSNIIVVALAVLGFGLVAGRLSRAPLTMPMLFTAGGVLLGPVLGVLDFGVDSSAVSVLAEATLVVVLFSDASRMDVRTVLREHSLALRLLGIGLPLALLIGTGAGLLLLPTLPVAACALLATALAPTDAALGQAFVEDETVPARIRQTLNVESGLNDGLAVPFLTVLLDVALRQTGSAAGYALLLGRLVGVGVLIGVLVGGLGGAALQRFGGRYGMVDAAERLATVALAALAYGGSELLGGNGFVAAFTAGLVVGTTARELLPRTQEFAETEGQLLTLLTFLLFGSVITADILSGLDLRVVLYALASLLLVRPLAVLVSLLGSGARPATVAFVAWAGPRGLASIVYAVVIAEATGVPGADEVFLVAGSPSWSAFTCTGPVRPRRVRGTARTCRASSRPGQRGVRTPARVLPVAATRITPPTVTPPTITPRPVTPQPAWSTVSSPTCRPACRAAHPDLPGRLPRRGAPGEALPDTMTSAVADRAERAVKEWERPSTPTIEAIRDF